MGRDNVTFWDEKLILGHNKIVGQNKLFFGDTGR
jgi:hypothetical protein